MVAKVGSQETPGVTDKFGFGIRNEAGQRLIEFCQENASLSALGMVRLLNVGYSAQTAHGAQYQKNRQPN